MLPVNNLDAAATEGYSDCEKTSRFHHQDPRGSEPWTGIHFNALPIFPTTASNSRFPLYAGVNDTFLFMCAFYTSSP